MSLHGMFHIPVHRCLPTYTCIRPTRSFHIYLYISLYLCTLSLPLAVSLSLPLSLSPSLPPLFVFSCPEASFLSGLRQLLPSGQPVVEALAIYGNLRC